MNRFLALSWRSSLRSVTPIFGIPRWVSCLAIAVALLLPACQTYQPRPLDLVAYADEWKGRSLQGATLDGYAESLEERGGVRAPFALDDGVSLPEAEVLALHFNPRLRVARAEEGVALATAEEAGWWPEPRLDAEVKRALEGAEDSPWDVGVGLGITIPLSGRLGVEEELRWAEHSAEWRRILVLEWELVTELHSAWLDWSSVAEKLSNTEEVVAQLEEVAVVAQQLVGVAELQPTEARLLQIELARRRAAILSLQATEEETRQEVLALLGLAPDTTLELLPLEAIREDPPSSNPSGDLLAHHPRILSARADYESAEQQLRLEVRRQFPDLELGLGASLEGGIPLLGVALGALLPLWNRNRQAIAQATAAREVARIRAEVEVERAFHELARTERRFSVASARRRAVLETVAPLVDEQAREIHALLELGEIDVVLLREALIASFDTRLELLDATIEEQRAAHELRQMLEPRWTTPPRKSGETP